MLSEIRYLTRLPKTVQIGTVTRTSTFMLPRCARQWLPRPTPSHRQIPPSCLLGVVSEYLDLLVIFKSNDGLLAFVHARQKSLTAATHCQCPSLRSLLRREALTMGPVAGGLRAWAACRALRSPCRFSEVEAETRSTARDTLRKTLSFPMRCLPVLA